MPSPKPIPHLLHLTLQRLLTLQGTTIALLLIPKPIPFHLSPGPQRNHSRPLDPTHFLPPTPQLSPRGLLILPLDTMLAEQDPNFPYLIWPPNLYPLYRLPLIRHPVAAPSLLPREHLCTRLRKAQQAPLHQPHHPVQALVGCPGGQG